VRELVIAYLLLNLTVGIGIAADASVLTLATFRRFETAAQRWKWVLAVGTSHTVLPMIGFVIGWGVADEARPYVTAAIYLMSAVIMAGLTVYVIREEAGGDDEDEEEEDVHELWKNNTVFFWTVMAVSWDALAAGAGKIPATKGWTGIEVLISFFLVGAVVGGIVWFATNATRAIRIWSERKERGAEQRLAWWLVLGIWTEIVTFTFFAWLGLERAAEALGNGLPGLALPAATVVTCAALFSLFGAAIRDGQLDAATEAMNG
jgi:putative Mn2+ efflux pump MntP